MKRGLLAIAAIALLAVVTGCHHNVRQNGCRSCGPQAGALAHGPNSPDHVPRVGHHHHYQSMAGPAGPATAQYGYPYYTNRAPRDFLVDNPPSIGY